jgi:hypothetical protein
MGVGGGSKGRRLCLGEGVEMGVYVRRLTKIAVISSSIAVVIAKWLIAVEY